MCATIVAIKSVAFCTCLAFSFNISSFLNSCQMMTRDFKLSLKLREPTSIYELSDDNLSEIFFRLPVRVLLCCQCVCKRFSKVITDPKFRKIQVNRAMASNTTSFCLVHLIVSDLSDICGSVENFKHRYDHILLIEEFGESTNVRFVDGLRCFTVIIWRKSAVGGGFRCLRVAEIKGIYFCSRSHNSRYIPLMCLRTPLYRGSSRT